MTSPISWPPEAELFRQRLEHRLRLQAMIYKMNEADVKACMGHVLMGYEPPILAGAGEASEEHMRDIARCELKLRRNALELEALAQK